MPTYAIVTAYIDDSLSVIDISNPAAPVFQEFLHGGNGANPPWLRGLMGIDIVGHYVYVASYLDNALNVIYSQEPNFSSIVGFIRGTGAPNWLGGATKVKVRGNFAYVTAYGNDALTIINIANPAAPTFVGSIQGAGAPNFIDGAWGLDVVGNYAYVCGYWDDALTVIDVTNPAAPVLVGSIQGAGAPPVGAWLGGARNVQVVGNYAYVVSYWDNALTVIDVTNPAAPAFAGSIQGIGAPNWLARASDVYVVGNHAYVTAYTDDALTIINVANPLAPAFVGSIQGAGAPNFLNGAHGVRVVGNLAYVSAYLDWALSIFNIANPAAPALVGTTGAWGAGWFLRGASASTRVASPVVVTQAHTNLTMVSATLNGLLSDDGGAVCDCGFEWGTTGSFGTTTPIQKKVTGESFSQSLPSLTPNTQYYYRTFASNAGGITYGSTRQFRTPIPVVVTMPATGITGSRAVINGIVADDAGFGGDARFQWGGSGEYGMETPWGGGYHSGDTFSVTLTGLREGTLYHFRAQFRNQLVASGGDMVFVTTPAATQMVFLTQDIAELLGSS